MRVNFFKTMAFKRYVLSKELRIIQRVDVKLGRSIPYFLEKHRHPLFESRFLCMIKWMMDPFSGMIDASIVPEDEKSMRRMGCGTSNVCIF